VRGWKRLESSRPLSFDERKAPQPQGPGMYPEPLYSIRCLEGAAKAFPTSARPKLLRTANPFGHCSWDRDPGLFTASLRGSLGFSACESSHKRAAILTRHDVMGDATRPSRVGTIVNVSEKRADSPLG